MWGVQFLRDRCHLERITRKVQKPVLSSNRSVGSKLVAPLLLFAFTIFGCMASLQSGLTVDDATEQSTFRMITSAAGSLLLGHVEDYNRTLPAIHESKYLCSAFRYAY
jgi:uncharacterized membrane protein YqgA involved in biofilm formation